MPPSDSALEPDQIAKIRRLLVQPSSRQRMWPVVAAAAFAACSALMLASAMIMAPPVTTSHISQDIAGRS